MAKPLATAFLVTAVSVLLAPSVTAAQPAVETGRAEEREEGGVSGSRANPLEVPKTLSPVKVDGVLDDEAWDDALVVPVPYEVRPAENTPAPVRTDCLLTYGPSHLYVAFRAYDPDPGAIQAHLSDRDTAYADDWVAVALDTFDDERRAYDFLSNPLGVQMDAIETRSGGDDSWDGIWDSAGRIYDWGYAVEMAIPFHQLRFQRTQGQQTWGFDAVRRYQRSVSHHLGAFPRDRNNDCYLCQTIKIRGFEGVSPGRNLEVAPTVTTIRTDERSELPDGELGHADPDVDAGLSVRWGMTPNLTLNGTVNPDFSQVEADSLQLDINAPFALFYSEKRPFFTEGSDFFRTLKNVVHTRTMRDPAWGLKLTGKEGANTLGAYVVRDEITNLIFPGSQSSSATSLAMDNTSAVLRYKRDFGTRYTLGAIATGREADEYANRVVGVDGTFRLTETDSIQLQLLRSTTRYPDEVAAAFGQRTGSFSDELISFEYDHVARNAGWWLDYEQVGADFRADLGFMPMVDYRNVEGGSSYTWIAEPGRRWTQIRTGNELHYFEDTNGGLIGKNASAWLWYQGTLQSSIYVRGTRTREVYNATQFDRTSFTVEGELRPIGDLELFLQVRYGDRIDYANTRLGKRILLQPYLSYNLGKHLRLILMHTFEQMTIEGDRLYTANISQSTIRYQFGRRTFVRAVAQYVDYDYNTELYVEEIAPEFRRLFSQFLFSYKINPQTVLLLGYSDNYFGSHEYGLTQADRTFFIKLGYAWLR
ncbi:MAG: carbohydrate binding family 9 domain-containing protein [bacterium]|nr:carbohydrate binding family 9 domain-containing protein [bacterium]